MTIKDKVERSKEIILATQSNYSNPVVATSFGKDSMVLIHLLLSLGIKPPMVFFREPFMPKRYEFSNEVIKHFGLTVYDWRPFKTSMQQNGDEVEIQNYYAINMKCSVNMTCPTGIVPPVEGKDFLCGLRDLLLKPLGGGFDAPWDVCYIGHKISDSDPIYGGDAGCRTEFRVTPYGMDFSYPLQDWTHEDIWEYSEEHNVPQNMKRYFKKEDGTYDQLEDKTYNPDYFEACTKCLVRGGDKYVVCPKTGLRIENISDKVPWGDQNKPSYMVD